MNPITDIKQFDSDNYYAGPLGVEFSEDKTIFRTWSPTATGVYLRVYADGKGQNLIETLPMERHWTGCWQVEILRNLEGCFYTYVYEHDHTKYFEASDLYAKSCGVNGNRSAIIDMQKATPYGFDDVPRPKIESPCDAVIYECHIRDFSIDESGGVKLEYRGKFLGMAQDGLIENGVTVGLAHLKELGITHVQLLPIYDFVSVDEDKPYNNEYNWGYDPKNYNCPEGSYSTDAENPVSRVYELKTLVMELHKNGIGVIMDVVYNHTYYTEKSDFQLTVPYYYHRLKEDNTFSNGSGVGNEIASEHKMVRRYIVDSILFWANEYKLDGFRFDLMAVLDTETVNLIRDELSKLDPYVMMYGEGWSGGECAIPDGERCVKWNIGAFDRMGVFNDNFRDAIKGNTFDVYKRGFVGGNTDFTETIMRGLSGSVKTDAVNGSDDAAWATEPHQTINYCEAHDNWTMWDKLTISLSDYSEEERVNAHKLSLALVLLAQGIPFLQLGQDFLRSKPKPLLELPEATHERFDENSYKSPDFTNSVKWSEKAKNIKVFRYCRELIRLRRENKLFRLRTADEIKEKLSFVNTDDRGVIVMKLQSDSDCIIVAVNPHREAKWIDIPKGDYFVRLDFDGDRHNFPLRGDRMSIAPISAVVLQRFSENVVSREEQRKKHREHFIANSEF